MYELYKKDAFCYCIVNKVTNLCYLIMNKKRILEGINATRKETTGGWPIYAFDFHQLELIETFTKESHPEYFI